MKYTAQERSDAFAKLSTHMRISDSGCYEWTGSRTPNGYGSLYWNGTTWFAHRLVMTVILGPIPKGMQVHHKCFNPSCVYPLHLEIVTRSKNQTLRNPARTHGPRSATGEYGIYLHKTTGKFKVAIRRDLILHHGGYFDNLDEAIVARDDLKESLGG